MEGVLKRLPPERYAHMNTKKQLIEIVKVHLKELEELLKNNECEGIHN